MSSTAHTSDAQLNVNRQNAILSTGPRSEEAKAAQGFSLDVCLKRLAEGRAGGEFAMAALDWSQVPGCGERILGGSP